MSKKTKPMPVAEAQFTNLATFLIREHIRIAIEWANISKTMSVDLWDWVQAAHQDVFAEFEPTINMDRQTWSDAFRARVLALNWQKHFLDTRLRNILLSTIQPSRIAVTKPTFMLGEPRLLSFDEWAAKVPQNERLIRKLYQLGAKSYQRLVELLEENSP